jgi:hypothetical protein
MTSEIECDAALGILCSVADPGYLYRILVFSIPALGTNTTTKGGGKK